MSQQSVQQTRAAVATRALDHAQRAGLKALKQVLKAAYMLNSTAGVRPQDHKTRLATAWRLHSALSRAAAATARFKPVLNVLPSSGLDALYERLIGDRQFRSDVNRALGYYLGAKAPEILQTVTTLGPQGVRWTYGVFSSREVGDLFNAGRRDSESSLRAATTYKTLSDNNDTYQICTPDGRCEPTDGGTFWTIFAVVAGIDLITAIGAGIADIFNSKDDDAARDEINSLDCNGIIKMSDSHWIASFASMISGPTGDDDEQAMLRVLKCLPVNRAVGLVNAFGLNDFMDEFQGSEYDQLVVRLRQCGLLGFADWDDDASRLFINSSSQATLAALSIADIVQLCKNMFAGSCGDDDEQAIIRLLSFQDLCKVKTILMHHISINEFDDNVDGEEWNTLLGIIVAAMPAPC
jgi:hypothetical protein